jgi:hypothetical protein
MKADFEKAVYFAASPAVTALKRKATEQSEPDAFSASSPTSKLVQTRASVNESSDSETEVEPPMATLRIQALETALVRSKSEALAAGKAATAEMRRVQTEHNSTTKRTLAEHNNAMKRLQSENNVALKAATLAAKQSATVAAKQSATVAAKQGAVAKDELEKQRVSFANQGAELEAVKAQLRSVVQLHASEMRTAAEATAVACRPVATVTLVPAEREARKYTFAEIASFRGMFH